MSLDLEWKRTELTVGSVLRSNLERGRFARRGTDDLDREGVVVEIVADQLALRVDRV